MKNHLIKEALYDIAGTFMFAVGIWCFIEPCRIAPGGASGAALLVNHLTGLPVGTVAFLINIPLLLCAYVFLNRHTAIKTIRTSVILTIMMDLVVSRLLPQYHGDRLISSALGGILSGSGMALVFMHGSTTGGSDILARLLQKKYPYMHTGYALMLIDALVIAASIPVYRELESALFGIVSMACAARTIDTILYGSNRGTMVTIISPHNEKIAQAILKQLNRGATIYHTTGAFSKKDSRTLMCVVDRKQFYLVKQIIDALDPHAFVIVSETKEVYGEGFQASFF